MFDKSNHLVSKNRSFLIVKVSSLIAFQRGYHDVCRVDKRMSKGDSNVEIWTCEINIFFPNRIKLFPEVVTFIS